MSIIRKVFIILLGVTLMFMNISGVKAQDDNTTTDFSNYITAASLDYKEGDKEIAYKTDTKLTEDTSLVFKLDADVPSSALSSDHKIDYQLPDNLNVDDTTSDHIYLKDDLTKSVGSYTIADHHMVIDLSTLDYGVDSTKSIELDLETTTSHLIFTDSEAKIYFRKATNESPTEVMVSVLQNYANDTKADPNSIIKNTNTYTNTKKSSKQVITMSGVKRVNSNVKARAGVTKDGYAEISDNLDDQAKNGALSGKYRLTGVTTLDKNMNGCYNAPVQISKDVTIDLNGQKLMIYDGLYFEVMPGGHLTIEDTKANQAIDTTSEASAISNTEMNTSSVETPRDAIVERNVPTKLKYYVTKATPNGVKTKDTTYKHEVVLSGVGRIYAETNASGGTDSLCMIEKGGTLDFNSGVAYNTGPHVVATRGETGQGVATMNLKGGYLIGNKNGNVVFNNAGNVLNIEGGVITNGKAQNGGGIYNNNQGENTYGAGKINLTGGIITGNEACGDVEGHSDGTDKNNRYSGGGIYMKSGVLNISKDAYITNNRKSSGYSEDQHFSVHGGGGVAADNESQVNMSGGYVTGNYSHEAGGGMYVGYFTQDGYTKLTLTGGIIASNIAQTGEGGGIRIGGAARGSICAAGQRHPIYITNNTTNTGDENNQTGDWGGGGIFVQTNGQLSVMNVIITQNIADGFGAGVSACPTGDTQIATEQGAAIYSNTAHGNHFSRGSGAGEEKKNEDAVAYDFYHDTNRSDYEENHTYYQDYFLAHPSNVKSYTITNGMLGKGSENYSGTFNKASGTSYEQEYKSRGQTAKFIGLSADPSEADINHALELATAYISGNHSHNHGGGIMTNGMLTLGESNEIFPTFKLDAYKAFKLKAANGTTLKNISMNTNQFKFEVYQHTGDLSVNPQWDGTKFTAGSGANSLVSEIGNEKAEEGSLGKIEANIPNSLFNEAGDYTFYLVEEDNEDKMITYDHSVYAINFKVKATGEKTDKNNNNIKIITYSITNITVDKFVKGNKTELNKSDYSYDQSASLLTLFNSNTETFKNTEQSYDLSITKNDSKKANKVLKDAEFTLYELDQNYHDTSIKSINISKYDTETTDDKGVAKFSGLLRDHLYYLKETKAPEQYKTSGPWIVEITNEGKAKFYDADCTENTNSDHPNDGDYITLTKNSGNLWKDYVTDLTKENNKESNVFSVTIGDEAIQYTMPNTGGIGTYIYYQAGFLLLTLVNIVWIIKRRVA